MLLAALGLCASVCRLLLVKWTCSSGLTHLNQDSVSTVGMQVDSDFVLRQAVVLVHGESVSFVHNIALHCGTPLTAPAKLTSIETCAYMLPTLQFTC